MATVVHRIKTVVEIVWIGVIVLALAHFTWTEILQPSVHEGTTITLYVDSGSTMTLDRPVTVNGISDKFFYFDTSGADMLLSTKEYQPRAASPFDYTMGTVPLNEGIWKVHAEASPLNLTFQGDSVFRLTEEMDTGDKIGLFCLFALLAAIAWIAGKAVLYLFFWWLGKVFQLFKSNTDNLNPRSKPTS